MKRTIIVFALSLVTLTSFAQKDTTTKAKPVPVKTEQPKPITQLTIVLPMQDWNDIVAGLKSSTTLSAAISNKIVDAIINQAQVQMNPPKKP